MYFECRNTLEFLRTERLQITRRKALKLYFEDDFFNFCTTLLSDLYANNVRAMHTSTNIPQIH